MAGRHRTCGGKPGSAGGVGAGSSGRSGQPVQLAPSLRSITVRFDFITKDDPMAPVTRLERDSTLPLGTAALLRLERLAGTLAGRGLDVTLVAPPSRVPHLQVARPAPDGGTGHIYASRGRDGNWWFWWPWAERIATAGNLEAAAATIEQALTRPG